MDRVKNKIIRSEKGVRKADIFTYGKKIGLSKKLINEVIERNYAYIQNKPYSSQKNPRRKYSPIKMEGLGHLQLDVSHLCLNYSQRNKSQLIQEFFFFLI